LRKRISAANLSTPSIPIVMTECDHQLRSEIDKERGTCYACWRDDDE